MENIRVPAYLPISTLLTFERRSCDSCHGKGKVPKWRYFWRACTLCSGKGMAMFVVNRVGQWENVSHWLMTVDGKAYDTFVQSEIRIPTWGEIDHAILANIDATLQTIRSDVDSVPKICTVIPIRMKKIDDPKK